MTRHCCRVQSVFLHINQAGSTTLLCSDWQPTWCEFSPPPVYSPYLFLQNSIEERKKELYSADSPPGFYSSRYIRFNVDINGNNWIKLMKIYSNYFSISPIHISFCKSPYRNMFLNLPGFQCGNQYRNSERNLLHPVWEFERQIFIRNEIGSYLGD